MRSLTALLLLLSTATYADALSLSFGPSLDGTVADKKALQIAYELPWGSAAYLSVDSGLLNGSGGLLAYGGTGLGVHVITPAGTTARIGFGPAVFSGVNDRLSSQFNFHIQARVGLISKGWEVGLELDHFSNAGIVPPNPGLDLAEAYIGVPL